MGFEIARKFLVAHDGWRVELGQSFTSALNLGLSVPCVSSPQEQQAGWAE